LKGKFLSRNLVALAVSLLLILVLTHVLNHDLLSGLTSILMVFLVVLLAPEPGSVAVTVPRCEMSDLVEPSLLHLEV
jgi:hypothetical protein